MTSARKSTSPYRGLTLLVVIAAIASLAAVVQNSNYFFQEEDLQGITSKAEDYVFRASAPPSSPQGIHSTPRMDNRHDYLIYKEYSINAMGDVMMYLYLMTGLGLLSLIQVFAKRNSALAHTPPTKEPLKRSALPDVLALLLIATLLVTLVYTFLHIRSELDSLDFPAQQLEQIQMEIDHLESSQTGEVGPSNPHFLEELYALQTRFLLVMDYASSIRWALFLIGTGLVLTLLHLIMVIKGSLFYLAIKQSMSPDQLE